MTKTPAQLESEKYEYPECFQNGVTCYENRLTLKIPYNASHPIGSKKYAAFVAGYNWAAQRAVDEMNGVNNERVKK